MTGVLIFFLTIIFFALFSMSTDIAKINKVLVRIAEALEREDEEDDAIECPRCRQFSLEWRENEPDVGDCFNCDRIYQNVNTKEEPHLRELKGGEGEKPYS